jgi:hypothetical protein
MFIVRVTQVDFIYAFSLCIKLLYMLRNFVECPGHGRMQATRSTGHSRMLLEYLNHPGFTFGSCLYYSVSAPIMAVISCGRTI